MWQRLTPPLGRQRWLIAALLAAALVFALAYYSPASDAVSDPYFALLVSQALLEHGTLALDAYETTADPPFFSGGGTEQLFIYSGHSYYTFPVGSSLFSLPVVWLARLRGRGMAQRDDNAAAQNQMSAILSAVLFLLLYLICAFYLDPAPSLAITIISTFGSSLVSTVGTALWNTDWALVFICAALWLMARYDSGRGKSLNPFVLALLMFAAFLCRPTSALFIVIVLVYGYLRARPVLLRLLLTLIVLLVAFALWNLLQFGVILPPYYALDRFSIYATPLHIAVLGELLSPSRGLLIYSPFLGLTLIGAVLFWRDLIRQPLFALSALWFICIVLLAAEATKWWGGWSFGPRVLTDAMPALVLLSVFAWKQLAHMPNLRRACAFAFVGLGVVGIWINSSVGLFNLDAGRWNGAILPNVDDNPLIVFDWRYPQILASEESLCARHREYMREVIAGTGERLIPLVRDASVRFNAPETQAIYVGWSVPESDFRWSECSPATILFRSATVPTSSVQVLEITTGSIGPQRVLVSLNDVRIGTIELPGTVTPPMPHHLPLDARLIHPNALNEITFETPDARRVPGARDSRRLGLSFVQLRFVPGTPN